MNTTVLAHGGRARIATTDGLVTALPVRVLSTDPVGVTHVYPTDRPGSVRFTPWTSIAALLEVEPA